MTQLFAGLRAHFAAAAAMQATEVVVLKCRVIGVTTMRLAHEQAVAQAAASLPVGRDAGLSVAQRRRLDAQERARQLRGPRAARWR